MPEIRNEVRNLADTMKTKFTPPDFVPGCEVQSIADISEYTTNNGWIEATVGPHNQQRVRYYGEPAGIQVGDFVDVEYFPNYRLYRVFGVSLGGTATTGGLRVDKIYDSVFGAVALQADAGGNLTLNGTRTLTIPTDLIHAGDPDNKLSFTDDQIEATVGGLSMLKLTETTQDLVEIGDTAGAGDVDINFNNGQMFLEGATGNFGIGTTEGTDNFTVQGASGVQATAAFYTGDGDGTDNNSFVVYLLGTPGSIANRERLLLQGIAGDQFRFRSDAAGTGTLRPLVFETGNNTSQVYLNTNGRVGVNANSPDAKFHSRQSSGAGAIAALALTQSDVDEPFTKYIGTAAAATLTRSIVAEADVTTATRQGFVKIEIEDLGNQVTDQDYYVPFYTLA
jgi:hypothetical protein